MLERKQLNLSRPLIIFCVLSFLVYFHILIYDTHTGNPLLYVGFISLPSSFDFAYLIPYHSNYADKSN